MITIPAAAGIYGEYREYEAHAEMLWGVDNELADKWQLLWKWYIGLMAGMIGSILVMLVPPCSAHF